MNRSIYRKCKWKTVTVRSGWGPYWATWPYTVQATIRFWTSGKRSLITLTLKRNWFHFRVLTTRVSTAIRNRTSRIDDKSKVKSLCLFLIFSSIFLMSTRYASSRFSIPCFPGKSIGLIPLVSHFKYVFFIKMLQ